MPLTVEVVVVGNAKEVHRVQCVLREILEVGVEVVVQLTWTAEVHHRTKVLIEFTAGRECGLGGKWEGVWVRG